MPQLVSRNSAILLGILFLSSVPVWYSLLQYGYLSYGDLRAFTPSWFPVDRYFSAWQFEGLGNAEARTPGEFLVSTIVLLTGSFSSMAQKVVFFSLLPFAGFFMFRFLKTLNLNNPSVVVGALFYAINPLTLQEFAGGALGGLWEYMLIPLVILHLSRYLKSGKIKPLLKFVSSLALASIFLVHAVIFVVGIPIAVFLLAQLVSVRGLSSILKFIGAIGSTVLLYPFLLAPALLPLILGYSSSIGYATNAMPTVQYTYVSASFSNSLRMIAIAWPGAPLQRFGYLDTTPQGLATWFIPVLAFMGCALGIRKKAYSQICLSLLAIILFVATFDELTRDKVTYSWFAAFPLLFQYESPTKLAYVQTFAFVPLVAILVHIAVEQSVSLQAGQLRRIMPIFLVGLAVSAVAVYSTPFMNGYGGINNVYGQSFYVRQDYIQAEQILNTFRGPGNFFRTLWLPLDYETYLNSGAVDSYTFSIPSTAELRGPNYPAIDTVTKTFDLLATNQSDAASRELGLASVKYVIVDSGASYQSKPQRIGAYWLVGNPQQFNSILSKSSSFRLFTTIGELFIFENRNYLPLFFLTNGNLNETWSSQEIQPVHFESMDSSSYEVDLSVTSNATLYFADSFHPGWTAVSDRETLSHEALGWANGFSVTRNDSVIGISFSGQNTRNFLLALQVVGVAMLVAFFATPQSMSDKVLDLVRRVRHQLALLPRGIRNLQD